MSITYSLSIDLNLKYTKENILKILEEGAKNKLIYFDYIWGEKYFDAPVLSPSEATEKIINNETNEDQGPSVLVKYKDTGFTFWVYKKNNLIKIDIGSPGYPWIKEFWNSDDKFIDYARYINLFLEICKDFEILSIKTQTDY